MYHAATCKLVALEETLRAALTEIVKLRSGLAKRASSRREGGRRAYYEDHDAVKRQRREYYHKRAAHHREVVACDRCGACVQRASIYRHRRSARCRATAATAVAPVPATGVAAV